MREFENGREGKKNRTKKKINREGKNGMDLSNLKSIRNLKLFFYQLLSKPHVTYFLVVLKYFFEIIK